jgi:predicted choloylglycine hydrolase
MFLCFSGVGHWPFLVCDPRLSAYFKNQRLRYTLRKMATLKQAHNPHFLAVDSASSSTIVLPNLRAPIFVKNLAYQVSQQDNSSEGGRDLNLSSEAVHRQRRLLKM